jgi:hypothetical protein
LIALSAMFRFNADRVRITRDTVVGFPASDYLPIS